MQTIYCYSPNSFGGFSKRTVSPTYEPASGEHLTSPEPATDDQLDQWFPGHATAVPVPTLVPLWAAQAALKKAGKYDEINTTILSWETADAYPLKQAAYFAWTMGSDASRSSAMISTLATEFSMSKSDIDAIFISADQIARVAA